MANNPPLSATMAGAFEHLPVGLFGSVMGLTGLSVAWRLATSGYGAPAWISDLIGVVAVLAFVAVAVGYTIKLITSIDTVLAEIQHPIASNMFGTFWISLVLLPLVLAPVSLLLARTLWVIGTVGMLLFAWYLVSRWLSVRHQISQVTPAWMIPVVGLLDVPLALPSLAWPQLHGVMVLGLALGLFFAIPLFTLVFTRLVFEPPLPDALQPSLLILLAPFAVGSSVYSATTGRVDLFTESLYILNLFMLAVLLPQLRHLGRCCPFKVSWWAVSFPLAATATAALLYAKAAPGPVTDGIALALLAFVSVVILGLLIRTVLGVVHGELRTLTT